MNPLNKTLLILILLLFCFWGNAQVSISYYSSSISKTGVAYDFNDRLWGELRIYGNTFLHEITPELVFCYNTTTKETHQVYAGLGLNVNIFTGVVLPVGLQFSPTQKWYRFSLHIEFQPTFDFGHGRTIIQSSWGLRYKLIK